MTLHFLQLITNSLLYFPDINDSSSKTPTIEMYAPNTYNGGYDDNLSSISEKSETYSNISPDYNVSTRYCVKLLKWYDYEIGILPV